MDDELHAIRRLKNGDIQGLELLVTRYEQAARDIVQQTFIRIFEHIHRFDEDRPFGPYFLRSVVNSALDTAQRTSRWENNPGETDDAEKLIEQAISVEAQVELNTLKQEIHNALGQLTPRQRASIVLRYYLEMSEKEMAQSLNAAPGTVKWLLFSARQRLRSLLGDRS